MIIRELLTRNTQKQKVPRPRIIHNLQLAKVRVHDLAHQLDIILRPPRVPHVVDAHPHAHEGIRRIPGRVVRVRSDAPAELRDLVDEAEHGRLVGRHERGVGGCAAVGKVVGEEGGLVEVGGEEADPVEAAAGGPAWEGGVA